MKFCLVLLPLIFSMGAQAHPRLERQWARSTLLTDYLKFRQLNRMPPILTKDLVIQGNAIDGIVAYKRNSGHQIWSLEFKNGVEGGAAADGDRLYFGANNGQFYCVDINTGKILWTFALNSESLTYPLVDGPTVYHVAGNNTLYAFDKLTGKTLWIKSNAAKSNMAVRGQTAPVIESGVLYLGFSDGNFSAFTAENGRELWTKRLGDDKRFNDVDATAVLSGQCLLVASFANALYCLDKSSGAIRWRHDFGGYQAVYVEDGIIYYATSGSEIHLLELDSGKLLRKIVNIKGLATEITGLGDHIVYGESNGSLVVRNKKTFEKVSDFNSGRGIFSRPSVDKESGQIYFVSNEANIYRVDLINKPEIQFEWGSDKNATR